MIGLMLVSTVGAILTDVSIPLFYKRFFDLLAGASGAAADSVARDLIRILVIILALDGVQWLFWRVSRLVNNRFSALVMADITNTSFEYLHRHSHRFFISRLVGPLVRKVNRLVNAFEEVSDKLYWDLYPMAIRISAVLVVLWFRSPAISLILFLWVLVYLAIDYRLTLLKLPYDTAVAETDSEVTGRLADTITNNVNVKIFTGLEHEAGRFRALTRILSSKRLLSWNVSEYISAVQAFLMILLHFGIFYAAVRFWQRGAITVGDFVLIQVYLIQILNRLWDFGRVVRRMYRSLAEAEEMIEILHAPHEVEDKPNASWLRVARGAVEFRNVSFTYTKTREVIRNFNLTIAPGEKVGLVGPSGAGKSTLVALIFRFFDLTDGEILIDGMNIADAKQESLRSHMALVPQDPILFHRTLMENIRYGRRDAADQEVFFASARARCDEFIEKLPERYETYVGERGIKLSGGERQRVAIARAILKNAPILILDEATSSLDSHSEKLIQEALEELMRGKTTLVIAHRLSTIMKMDRIVVIEQGKIREIGTHADLLEKREGLYKELWGLQAGGFLTE